ncbi:MAG: glycerophosphodiester phosphodiesterase family protein [Methylococcales bacterium]
MPQNIPHLVAHRGFMKEFPENTRLSIAQAIRQGAHFVEFDVQCTKDHQLVVIHDDTLERTTDSSGAVNEMAFAVMEHVSAHEPKRFGEQFKGESLVTLKQMMETIKQSAAVHVFVEIKEECLNFFGHEHIMDYLLDELLPHQEYCTIISFDEKAIEIAQSRSWSVGWVIHQYDDSHYHRARQLNPEYLICNHQKLDLNNPPWPGPWQWMLYDITDAALALEYAQRGVNFIETEDIGAMLKDPLLHRT